MSRSITKKAFVVVVVVFGGFLGGGLSPFFIDWVGLDPYIIGHGDSIASKYIAFTTFIFVATTALITFFGYFLTKELSDSKEKWMKETLEELTKKAGEDHEVAEKLVLAIMGNDDVKRHVESQLDEYIESRIDEHMQAKCSATDEEVQEISEDIEK